MNPGGAPPAPGATGSAGATGSPGTTGSPGGIEQAMTLLGGAATAPRRAIVESLVAEGRLRTAETLLHDARARVPGTSLATVYRTIDRLDAAGAIKRATLASGEVGYAYCEPGHHEHAICLRCGALQVVRPCVIRERPPLEGFSIASHTLDFTGICAACARAMDSATDG